MALDIKGIKRVFKLKKGNSTLVLEDPDSRMSLTEVTDFYSMNYPELTTATLHGPELEEDRATSEGFGGELPELEPGEVFEFEDYATSKASAVLCGSCKIEMCIRDSGNGCSRRMHSSLRLRYRHALYPVGAGLKF